MFYELIYTRCRNGFDILSNGNTIPGEGYKVYSCSQELFRRDGLIDSEFLMNIAQAKQSYDDVYSEADKSSSFMDDAYIYCVPDFGKCFIVDFHPVHYDPSCEGDYVKKPGNFINQIFAGDFGDFYAWELFGDSNLWDAKSKDEPYYYAVEPSTLPKRSITPYGEYTLDDVRNFISEGRGELLQKAVAFLLEQYSFNSEQRKYLVIRDSCSRNIELWVAAIECAFSMSMAAGLPFATRLDKYQSANIYTVRASDGKYQPMINFQDKEQRIRFRAMIVGVNMEDKANNVAVMPFADSYFAVLDGVGMKADFDADISAEYFRLITKFDEEHIEFCQEFLQSLDIRFPSPALPDLYRAFRCICDSDTARPKELSQAIKTICRFNLTGTQYAQNIYSAVKNSFGTVTEHDSDVAFVASEWVERHAPAMNDSYARESLADSVCALMRNIMFKGRHELEEKILAGNFRHEAAAVVVSPEMLNLFMSSENPPEEGLHFLILFVRCFGILGRNPSRDEIEAIVSNCINLCGATKDTKIVRSLLDFLSGKDSNKRVMAEKMMLDCAGDYGEFVAECILSNRQEILSSCRETVRFCGMLKTRGLAFLAEKTLRKCIKATKNLDELAGLAKFIAEADYISVNEKAELFIALDSRVKYGASMKLAEAVQKYRPENATCAISANVMGLECMISSEKSNKPFCDILDEYAVQGFPNMKNDEDFIYDFCETFIDLDMNDDDFAYICDLLFRRETPWDFLLCVVYELVTDVKKHRGKWDKFLKFSSKNYGEEVINAVLDVLSEIPNPEKILKQLKPRGNGEESEVFNVIKKRAERDRPKRGVFGIFKGLFSGGREGD